MPTSCIDVPPQERLEFLGLDRGVRQPDDMTPDDWWTRLVYEAPTPVAEIRACHMSKLHISVARHLATGHGVRFERQVGLHVLTAKHKDFHGSTVLWPDLPHTHGLPHEPSQSLSASR